MDEIPHAFFPEIIPLTTLPIGHNFRDISDHFAPQ